MRDGRGRSCGPPVGSGAAAKEFCSGPALFFQAPKFPQKWDGPCLILREKAGAGAKARRPEKEGDHMGDWHSRPVGRILQELDSRPEGLTRREAERRLEREGRNELDAPPGPSMLPRIIG